MLTARNNFSQHWITKDLGLSIVGAFVVSLLSARFGFRARRWLRLLVPLVFGHLGCSSVDMTAAQARSPILLGPIACIGCAGRPPERTEATWQTARARRRAIGALTLVDTGNEKSFFFGQGLTTNPCGEDFRLSDLHSSAWVLHVPILFYMADLSIDAELTRTLVPGGKCLSGP